MSKSRDLAVGDDDEPSVFDDGDGALPQGGYVEGVDVVEAAEISAPVEAGESSYRS